MSYFIQIASGNYESAPPVCGRPACSPCGAHQVALPQRNGNCPTCDVCLECPVFKCAGCPNGVQALDRVDRNGCKVCPMCPIRECPLPSCLRPNCPRGTPLIADVLSSTNCPGCPICSCRKPTCNACPSGTVPDTRLQTSNDGCAVCPKCIKQNT